MKKGYLIYGRYSGNKQNLHRIIEIASLLRDKYQLIITPHRLEKDYAFLDLLFADKPDSLIVAGGDGTINYIANYMLTRGIDIPLGIIPSGTCNDFARCHNIPKDPVLAAEVIGRGKTLKVDVGLINNQEYFLTAYAGGLFAGVSGRTNPNLKKRFGPLAYYMEAFIEAVKLKSFPLSIKTESRSFSDKAVLFAVLNGKHIAGLSDIMNNADTTDGIMDILIIKQCHQLELASLFLKVFNREIASDKKVEIMRARQIEISIPAKNISITIDGEKAETGPGTIEVIPRKLQIFIP